MARLPDDVIEHIVRYIPNDCKSQLALLSISSAFFNIGMKSKYQSVSIGYFLKNVKKLEARLCDPYAASYVTELCLSYRPRQSTRSVARVVNHHKTLARLLRNMANLNHLEISLNFLGEELAAKLIPVLRSKWRGSSRLRKVTLTGKAPVVDSLAAALVGVKGLTHITFNFKSTTDESEFKGMAELVNSSRMWLNELRIAGDSANFTPLLKQMSTLETKTRVSLHFGHQLVSEPFVNMLKRIFADPSYSPYYQVIEYGYRRDNRQGIDSLLAIAKTMRENNSRRWYNRHRGNSCFELFSHPEELI